MYKQKLAIGLSKAFGMSYEEQIPLLKKIGFEEFFINACSNDADVKKLVSVAKDADIGIQSMHAPFNHSDDFWVENCKEADEGLDELLKYLEVCSEYEIPIMVTHAFIGFDNPHVPNDIGVERYGKLARRAGELGIMLALENTEGDEFLARLMNDLKGEKSVGFCWDCGHEMCYNYGRDLIALYGDRLICTHLNDNLGIRSNTGKIFWHDDLHLLPFDGIIDWNYNMSRLSYCGYRGTLTFELSRVNKPDRLENQRYIDMSPEMYLTQAYERACRVAALKLKYDNE